MPDELNRAKGVPTWGWKAVMGRLHGRVGDPGQRQRTNAPERVTMRELNGRLLFAAAAISRQMGATRKMTFSQSCNDLLKVSEHSGRHGTAVAQRWLTNSRGLDGDSIHFYVDG